MSYLFKGTLMGELCEDWTEPLMGVGIRLYRDYPVSDSVSPAEGEAIWLTPAQIENKAPLLIAETVPDEDGEFHIELGRHDEYNGELFEVDLYCERAPHASRAANPAAPLQFTLARLQPQWTQFANSYNRFANWNYTVPASVWCAARKVLDAWTICGSVTAKGLPAANVTVSAFDMDWVQDDSLGSAITDAHGRFRIEYTAADFHRTPFSPDLNLELTLLPLTVDKGPDLYFRVTAADGVMLLSEARQKGMLPGRADSGSCVRVALTLP